MKLSVNDWQNIASYLFSDLKLNDSGSNLSALKSRYVTLAKEFTNKDLTRENFNKYLYQRKLTGYKATSLNNLIKMAKHLANYYKLDGFKDISYYDEVRTEYDLLTPDDIKKLAEVKINYGKAREKTNNTYRALIYFLALTGCRGGEALGIKWSELVNNTNCYTVTFAKTKNGDARRVTIPPRLYEFLNKLPRDGDYVFTTYRGNKLDEPAVNLDLKRRAEAIGLKKRVFCHLFRYSFITTELRENVDSIKIARIVGHRDINSTNYYATLLTEDLLDAQMSHPLLRECLENKVIADKIRKYLDKLLYKKKYQLKITETNNRLRVDIVYC